MGQTIMNEPLWFLQDIVSQTIYVRRYLEAQGLSVSSLVVAHNSVIPGRPTLLCANKRLAIIGKDYSFNATMNNAELEQMIKIVSRTEFDTTDGQLYTPNAYIFISKTTAHMGVLGMSTKNTWKLTGGAYYCNVSQIHPIKSMVKKLKNAAEQNKFNWDFSSFLNNNGASKNYTPTPYPHQPYNTAFINTGRR